MFTTAEAAAKETPVTSQAVKTTKTPPPPPPHKHQPMIQSQVNLWTWSHVVVRFGYTHVAFPIAIFPPGMNQY